VTPPGIDPGTVRLVEQFLKHYATHRSHWLSSIELLIMLYSYTSMNCITVLSQSFLLMFVTTLLTLHLKSPAMGIVLIILHTPMLAATAERPEVQGWAFKMTSSRGTRQLMVNYLYSTCKLTLHYSVTLDQAVSRSRRPNIIWRVY
jgi:hypothetical protein